MRLLAARLQNQLIAGPRAPAPAPAPAPALARASAAASAPSRSPALAAARGGVRAAAEVVRWLGAVQAQDYFGSLWALGLRAAGATEASVERALADGSVIRTHVFRGTWQYVTREDVRWMVELVGERLIASTRARRATLGLDAKTLVRCADAVTKALAGGQQLTRTELAGVLARRRIETGGGRLVHVLGFLELRGVICGGARRNKQPTFALLEELAPSQRSRSLPREQALAELTTRYFQSRGPATVHDFGWWSGLPLREVREGIELAKRELRVVRVAGVEYWSGAGAGSARTGGVHLLPAFDEYVVAYKDRSAFVEAKDVRRVNSGGGMLNPALVIDGRVAGTWRRTLEKSRVSLEVEPFRELTERERTAVVIAARRYAAFLGRPESVEIRG